MAKYHVNPKTGTPGQCNAVHQCRFGASDSEHYDSKEAARNGFEAAMASGSVPESIQKNLAPNATASKNDAGAVKQGAEDVSPFRGKMDEAKKLVERKQKAYDNFQATAVTYKLKEVMMDSLVSNQKVHLSMLRQWPEATEDGEFREAQEALYNLEVQRAEMRLKCYTTFEKAGGGRTPHEVTLYKELEAAATWATPPFISAKTARGVLALSRSGTAWAEDGDSELYGKPAKVAAGAAADDAVANERAKGSSGIFRNLFRR